MKATARILLPALAVLVPSTQVLAQKVGVYGLGNNTCGEAMQQIGRMGRTQEVSYADWLGGFISGYNMAISDKTKSDALVGYGVSFDTLTAAFKNRCSQDATKFVMQAAKEIYQELGKRR